MIVCQGIGKLWEIRGLAGKSSSEDLHPSLGANENGGGFNNDDTGTRDREGQCHGDSAYLRKFDTSEGGSIANSRIGTRTCRSLNLQQSTFQL